MFKLSFENELLVRLLLLGVVLFRNDPNKAQDLQRFLKDLCCIRPQPFR